MTASTRTDYATQSQLSLTVASYLPLSGGAMTGPISHVQLVANSTGNVAQIELQSSLHWELSLWAASNTVACEIFRPIANEYDVFDGTILVRQNLTVSRSITFSLSGGGSVAWSGSAPGFASMTPGGLRLLRYTTLGNTNIVVLQDLGVVS